MGVQQMTEDELAHEMHECPLYWAEKYQKLQQQVELWQRQSNAHYMRACHLEKREADLEQQVEALRGDIGRVQGFAIWLTGCGYDFTQHDYYTENQHLMWSATAQQEE